MVRHLALIMDGNRRWAKKRGLQPWLGHKEGTESVKRVLEFCLEKQIKHLSLYTFSLENFRRSEQEQTYLFTLMVQEAEKHIDSFIKQQIRVRFIGDRSLFPPSLIETIDQVESKTEAGTALQLQLLFCYGSRQEIITSIKAIAHKVMTKELAVSDISDELFSSYLWTSAAPDPELIIRTGGVKRLSNFLLYQAAYSELYFLDCLWPEITKDHLESALTHYADIKRNFGA